MNLSILGSDVFFLELFIEVLFKQTFKWIFAREMIILVGNPFESDLRISKDAISQMYHLVIFYKYLRGSCSWCSYMLVSNIDFVISYCNKRICICLLNWKDRISQNFERQLDFSLNITGICSECSLLSREC